MKKVSNKIILSLTFVYTIMQGNIFADLDQRVSDLEKKLDAVTTTTPNGQISINTKSALAEMSEGLFISADILYWHTKLGGTEFTYSEENSFSDIPIRGSLKELDFNWDWGFRFGLGYRLEYDGWQAFLDYTYFQTSDSSKQAIDGLGLLIPLRSNYAIVGSLTEAITDFIYCKSASSQIGINYDDLIFSIGREYFVSRSLCVHPYFGVKSSWLDFNQITRYSGGFIIQNNTVNVKDTNNFWGIGPHIGFEGKWHVYNGFSLIENIDAALLFSYYKVRHQEYYSLDPADNQIRLSADMHRYSPFCKILIGLGYEHNFEQRKQHIELSLGYEVDYYFRVNQVLYDFNFTTNGDKSKYARYSEDLSFYGVTFNFRWDF